MQKSRQYKSTKQLCKPTKLNTSAVIKNTNTNSKPNMLNITNENLQVQMGDLISEYLY